MMRYGDDVPLREARVQDHHAQLVWAEHAILDEFRAVFNLASYFAEVIQSIKPDHPALDIARVEGMLGRFLNEVHQQEQPPSVSELHESGVLEVSERAVGELFHEGLGALSHGEAPSSGDSVAQGSGGPDSGAQPSPLLSPSVGGSAEVPEPDGSGTDVASGSVHGVGESV